MSSTTNNSNHQRKQLNASEITSIEMYSNQRDNTFYVGEDVTITAKYSNPFVLLYPTWQFNGSSNNINTKLPKYAGTRTENNKDLLIIRDCCELDAGEYSVVANCKANIEICSKELKIEVIKGRPEVELNEDFLANFNKHAEIQATIRSFPKHDCVTWKKGEKTIDLSLPKYAGSSDVGDRPVLCINNVEEEDGDVYTIEVQNELGKGTCSRKMEIIGDSPEVGMNEQILANFNENAEIQATIRSFPKQDSVIWKKGEKTIDLSLPKYAGSSDVGDRPVLCINNVEEEDGDVYTIEVQNELGKGTCCGKLVVIEGNKNSTERRC